MKDTKKKYRDWENDNYIMRQYGKSIKANITAALLKTHKNIMTYKAIQAAEQELFLKRIPEEDCGHC